jgi:hypothetical protein
MARTDISLAISLGDNKAFAIDLGNQLMVVHQYAPGLDVAIKLGPCTKKRIEELQEYLERLKIHASSGS